MATILENSKENIKDLIKFRFGKISILFFSMIFFSLLYMLLDDQHFEGVNKFKEIVKEEVIKDKVKQELVEQFTQFNNENKNKEIDNIYSSKIIDEKINKEIKEEKIIEETTKETEKEVKNNELEPEKVEPNLIDKYLNRLYFSIITGCLLGYGDVYPVTNTSKILASIQGLITVSLIIY